MRKIIGLIILALFLFSCKENPIEKTEEAYPDKSPKVVGVYKLNENQEDIKIEEKILFPTGELKMKGPITNNLRHGVWVAYFKSGKKQSEGEFVNGVRNGFTTVYHENGNKLYEGFYTDGKESGVWKFYSKDGSLNSEKKFD